MMDKALNRKFIEYINADDTLDAAIDWIRDNLKPHDVFPESALDQWAENNDYVKDEG